MKIIDLTMPIYEGMGAGYHHPSLVDSELWDNQVQVRKGWSYEEHERSIWSINIFLEAGTCLVLPAYRKEFMDDFRVDKVMTKYVLRDTVVMDVPKGSRELTLPDDIDRAFSQIQGVIQKGDAVMVRTGWGDHERYSTMGREYYTQSPYYTDAAAARLGKIMTEYDSDLFFYDNANLGGPQPETGQYGGLLPFKPTWGMVGGLVSCGAIKSRRFKTIVLPLKVEDAAISLCSVVAIEE